MSASPLSVLFPATKGMDMRIEHASYDGRQAGRFVQWTRNMRIAGGYWRTRFPFREVALEAPDGFHERDWQGCILYQPHDGQGVHYLGVGRDRLIGSYGGRLYVIDIGGTVTEVAGEEFDTGQSKVPCSLEQAENYVIRTDGSSRTLIYDGKEGVSFSRGYNKEFPNASSVPNNAGPIRYLAGRLWVSAYGRRLYAGDPLHRLEPEEAIDVLRFREQAFDATSQWFAPEASQGDTVALSLMKLGGREYVVMHGDNMGMTGVLLNIPRADWASQPMTLTISNETAAAGPYAYAEGDWRLLFRSRRGIEEERLILAEDNAVGGTAINIGKQVYPLLDADIEEYLVFSTLINPARWERSLVTVSPRIQEGRAFHRGVLSLNRNPGDAIEAGEWAWEGVWTLPDRMGRVQQMVEGRIDQRQRVFFLLSKPGGNGLAEMQTIEGLDTLADGTKIRQNGAIRTYKLSTRSEYLATSFEECVFLLRDVASEIEAELWIRDSGNEQWRIQKTLKVCLEKCGHCDKCCSGIEGGEIRIPIGKLNEVSTNARWVQFHLETWGIASFDFVMVTGESESIPQKAETGELSIENCECPGKSVFQYEERP
jgi:hypothetical protein